LNNFRISPTSRCIPSNLMSWFSNLFGFMEKIGSVANLEWTKQNFKYSTETGVLISVPAPDREFKAGWFERPSLRDLRNIVDLEEARRALPGSVKVREIVSDVSELHTMSENRHALFQAASQFNCLEFPSQRGKPENGITVYSSDRTQGPACAIACAPGTVVRNYFGMKSDDTALECQTQDNQVNNLADCEEFLENAKQRYFEVMAGYTMSSDGNLMRLNKALDEATVEGFKERLRVGFQWDTEVTNSKFGSREYSGPQLLVSQIYASACSVSYSSGSSDNWAPLASMVLDASYEATLYGSVMNAMKYRGEHGSKKVFLTALGGGVFGNDTEWIADAMSRAFKKFEGIDLEVTIVSFGRSEPGFRHLLTA